MPVWLRIVAFAVGGMALGALLGASALGFLAGYLGRLIAPEIFKYDGFGYVLVFVIPLGGILGLLTGGLLTLQALKRRAGAGWIGLVGGSILAVLLVSMMAILQSGDSPNSSAENLFMALIQGIPLLWSATLAVGGIRLLRRA